MNNRDRRSFIKKTGMAGLGLGMVGSAPGIFSGAEVEKGTSLGIFQHSRNTVTVTQDGHGKSISDNTDGVWETI